MHAPHAPRATGVSLVAALSAALGACAPATRTTPAPVPAPAPAPAATTAAVVPASVRWTRVSAEHRALYTEIYRFAGRHIEELATGLAAGTWGVILDADETVLDNSPYELGRARLDSAFTPASWAAWVRRSAAPALPGAAAFIAHVHEIGGRVVIVTNRADEQCGDTRENFRALAIAVDTVLCQHGSESDKNARFDAVQRGVGTLPPLRVLMWVGDNIQDFPHTTQALRDAPDSALAPFGDRFIVLPNPMYGSWEKNEVK
ncbi:MAG TPA: HAD family acid phosphatase [Gemmatimonadaceae bacterium]